MRKANNTVSCDSTHNSKLLLYTVNVSDPTPPHPTHPQPSVAVACFFLSSLFAGAGRLIGEFIHPQQLREASFARALPELTLLVANLEQQLEKDNPEELALA